MSERFEPTKTRLEPKGEAFGPNRTAFHGTPARLRSRANALIHPPSRHAR
jgi:hypothetical protein